MGIKTRGNYAPGYSMTDEDYKRIFLLPKEESFKEHDIVETIELVQRDNLIIPKGTKGTIIHIWSENVYCVEIDRGPESPLIADLYHKELKLWEEDVQPAAGEKVRVPIVTTSIRGTKDQDSTEKRDC
jgi:hypothetical protein